MIFETTHTHPFLHEAKFAFVVSMLISHEALFLCHKNFASFASFRTHTIQREILSQNF